MSVVSLKFLFFCLATFVVYYVVPKKIQWVVLLIASLGFYWYSGPAYMAYIIFCSIATYFIGRRIGTVREAQRLKLQEIEDRAEKKALKERMGKVMRRMLALGVIIMVIQLFYLKYTGFIVDTIFGKGANVALYNIIEPIAKAADKIFSKSLHPGLIGAKDIIAPLGCSYYTFTMISYLADIYSGKIKPQKNYLKYLLFVSYFPQIIQGPIPRYGELSQTLLAGNKFNFDGIRDGIIRVIYGVFKKIVIAEPIGIFVASVYKNYKEQSGWVVFVAALLYSVQIYADFSGYTDIVSGVSETFGVKLGKNFERPFFAKTIPEFWRRWHISLSSWFREYVFYGLSSSKGLLKLNKSARNVFGNTVGRVVSTSIPVLSVWLLTGFWHGASWNMILWGGFHGILIMFSIIFEPLLKKLTQALHIKTESFSWGLFQMARTTFLCTIGRIISWNSNLDNAFGIIKQIFNGKFTALNTINHGLTEFQFSVLLFAIAIMLGVSLISEYCGGFRNWLAKQSWWLRWILIFSLVAFIFLFGTYGKDAQITFIYEQF